VILRFIGVPIIEQGKRMKNYLCVMKSIQEYISEVEDFRIEKKCLHKLSDILLIGFFTYLSNGKDYEDMVLFAKSHKDFLRPYAELPNGIPSHDTFRRVFSAWVSENRLCVGQKKMEDKSNEITAIP
jgi:hypothetical protein